MSRLSDPFDRRKSFHAAPRPISTQAARRAQALDAQKQRRTSAIEAARTAFRDLDDLEDLSLAGSSEDDQDSPPPPDTATQTHSASAPDHGVGAGAKQRRRKGPKPRFKAWAKNLLSYAETLDLRHGLPDGIETDWRAVVVPKGKRCLCASATDQGANNTILYSRVAGRALGRFRTVLPPDCLLDTVWDAHLGVLWVLDVCKWRSQYLVQCEADMRAFFISSKLSELPTQFYAPELNSASGRTSPARPLLVLPVPNLGPPLSPPTLLPLLTTLSASPTPSIPISALVHTLAPPAPEASGPDPTPLPTTITTTVTLPLHSTGLLLYLSHALYESGSTTLVGWVPCPSGIAYGMEGGEGVRRMGELVQEWEREGRPRVVGGGDSGGGGGGPGSTSIAEEEVAPQQQQQQQEGAGGEISMSD